MLIDMHAHVIPESFPAAAGRASAGRWPSMDHFEAGRARVMIAGENFRTVHEGNWSVERRLRDMETGGVDAEAISPLPELMSYWFTPTDGLEICRYLNEFIVRLCESAPGRFFGLGIVPLQDPELATKELASVKQLGLAGVEVGSNVLGRSLGEERFAGFFAEAQRLGLAVFVHALHPTFMDRLPESLSNSVGFPSDTGLTIASLIAGGTAEKCLDLRIAFSHGGGTFPFVLPRYQNAWGGSWNEEPFAAGGAARAELPHAPVEYARRFYYDTLVFDRRAIRYLVEMVGAKQLLVGTDYPYMVREVPVGKTLRSMDLAAGVVEDITWHNCLRFLGVPAPVASSR